MHKQIAKQMVFGFETKNKKNNIFFCEFQFHISVHHKSMNKIPT
jgi:hypothetical protein